MKKELDKLRAIHGQESKYSPSRRQNYSSKMSPDSIRSAKYFSTNEEHETKPKNLIHEYGVLKRTQNMGSTPSFKPYQTSSQKQISMFSSVNDQLQSNDTMGNKFDELERRLISLENTLDGRPAEGDRSSAEYMSSPKSFNPFSPNKNKNMYIEDEFHTNSNQNYSTNKLSEKYATKNESPKYIDSSLENNEENEDMVEKELNLKTTKLQDMLQRAEKDNSHYSNQLSQKDEEIARLHYDLERKTEEFDHLFYKFERVEKDNERLTTTYEVLREQEMQKVKQDLKAAEEHQQQLESLRADLSQKENEIKGFTERLGELSQKLREANGHIERLSKDKEALIKLTDTREFEDKIQCLEQDIAHYKNLLDNERVSRQSISENMSKKDYQLDELEKINYEMSTQIGLKNGIIERNEKEISNLRYQLQDGNKDNEHLHRELKEQNERILELEEDLAH